MKLFQIVSVVVSIVSFLFVSSTAYSQVQFYGAETDLSPDGNAKIRLVVTFKQPVNELELPIFGAVKNLAASSNSGPVDCNVRSGAASIIRCIMNLTQEKRTLEISFETADFVKNVETNSLFSIDLSLNLPVEQSVASVRLPEGYALTNTSLIPSISPQATDIASDGRRIIVNWKMDNLTLGQPFRFQTMYEPVKAQFPVGLVSAGVLSFLVLAGTGFFFYRRIRKPKEVILSVLDDFEKRVIEIMTAAGGEINQRKVVQDTNLSKAKVSRVVKRLQERGLVEVTRLGRTNKLKLVQKKFEGN